MIIRTYAIFEGNRWILYLSVPLGISTVALLVLAVVPNAQLFATLGVHINSSAWRLQISFIITIAFDTLIFVLLGFRVAFLRFSGDWELLKSRLWTVLIRDGTLLFVVLLISNVAHFILFELSWNSREAVNTNMLHFLATLVLSGTNCELTRALAVALVSRMIFNLREIGTEAYESAAHWRSGRLGEMSLGSMQFDAPGDVDAGSNDGGEETHRHRVSCALIDNP